MLESLQRKAFFLQSKLSLPYLSYLFKMKRLNFFSVFGSSCP